VIVLTGHGTVENAVEAMRQGAWDFLTKPVNLDHLGQLVKRALANRELVLKHRQMEEELEHRKQFETIIGTSAAMRRIFDTISRAAPSKASILITGESGVGKELVADAIHELSPRKGKPLIKVHCAALASSLLESELFGHEKGAFTGAVSRVRGRFELANEGTLFLDEIGEIDQNIQIKLLRVLQEKKFERLGGEVFLGDDGSPAHHHRVFHAVPQLPYVAGPVVGVEGGPGLFVYAFHRFTVLFGKFPEESGDQERDIVFPVPQGRDVDVYHIQPEVEILPEIPLLDLFFQVPVGGRHDAHVGFNGLLPPKALEFLFLQNPQKLYLDVLIDLAYLV
jgi:hypothetical protein